MDREQVLKGLEQITNDPFMNARADYWVLVCKSALAMMKEQERTINELQNAYGYLQKQFFEAQDKLLKEQERKKGSWDYGTQCSVCKGTIIPPKDRKIRVNFCPWCGADMRDSYE